MYHPTTRVLAVLELLRTHQRLSGPELAERLEVDLRTVRRYVTMLQDLGIPIEAERGRHGGYRLLPGYKLPPLVFSDDEALAVTLGLLATRRLGLAVAAPAVEGALAKVEQVLPPTVRRRLAAVQETLVTDLTARPETPSPAMVVAMSAAAYDTERVRIRYASSSGEETERAVDPYGLVYLNGLWYAAGYCHLRQDRRIFRLDRIREITTTDERFERPVGFDSLAFVQQSLAQMPETWRVEVLLRTSLADAQRRVPAHVATLEETPEGVILRDYAESLDWMARSLVALGCPFLVREPPELRDALRGLATQVASLAEAPAG